MAWRGLKIFIPYIETRKERNGVQQRTPGNFTFCATLSSNSQKSISRCPPFLLRAKKNFIYMRCTHTRKLPRKPPTNGFFTLLRPNYTGMDYKFFSLPPPPGMIKKNCKFDKRLRKETPQRKKMTFIRGLGKTEGGEGA